MTGKSRPSAPGRPRAAPLNRRNRAPDHRVTGVTAPVMFRPIRARRAFEEICERIREQLALGVLKPGDKLPPERELAQQLGVSRNVLREALRVTGAAGTVHLANIEDTVDRAAGPIDCVTARAVAPLHQLIGYAAPLVKKGAKALFLKGQDVEVELTEATKYWKVEPRLHASRTGGHGWIVEIDEIEQRNPSTSHDGSPL